MKSDDRIHGLRSKQMLKEFSGHTSFVNNIRYSRDFTRVISASSDGSVRIWDVKTTDCIKVIDNLTPQLISSTALANYDESGISLQANEHTVYETTTSGFNTNKTTDATNEDSNMSSLSSFHHDRLPVRKFVFHPDSKKEEMYVINDSLVIYVLHSKNGKLLRTLYSKKLIAKYSNDNSNNNNNSPKRNAFTDICISCRGNYLYALGEDKILYCFNTLAGKLVHVLKLHEQDVLGISHHCHRNILASYSLDKTLKVSVTFFTFIHITKKKHAIQCIENLNALHKQAKNKKKMKKYQFESMRSTDAIGQKISQTGEWTAICFFEAKKALILLSSTSNLHNLYSKTNKKTMKTVNEWLETFLYSIMKYVNKMFQPKTSLHILLLISAIIVAVALTVYKVLPPPTLSSLSSKLNDTKQTNANTDWMDQSKPHLHSSSSPLSQSNIEFASGPRVNLTEKYRVGDKYWYELKPDQWELITITSVQSYAYRIYAQLDACWVFCNVLIQLSETGENVSLQQYNANPSMANGFAFEELSKRASHENSKRNNAPTSLSGVAYDDLAEQVYLIIKQKLSPV
ncbi:transducin family protein / WD-40 repeat family protein [Reticulomyxa filosa]|uniref:WD40 repeat-containing protein SMU1 n=1 Tax=Reticulomyxa filosa TaxID=46433 RepID=X6MRZ5_RETFI|nr:transducin family protein / WD-40 repeat family protein [Reticulomyxa filosa]|eukprot:ETO16406.1 transducin family protein / WD-40 repeat family protein [Reticulomyxa filosa]